MVNNASISLNKEILLKLKNPCSSFGLGLISPGIFRIIRTAMDCDFAQSAVDI